jgi:cardiolipin synthase
MTDPAARALRILERDRRERAEHRVVTVPNVISILRLVALMPLFVVVLLRWHSPGWALVVALVLGASDFVDGYIARRFHQVTRIGKALDPVADRISQIVVSAALVIGGYLPVWMAIVVAASDLILGLALLVRRHGAIPVRWIGRVRTAILMIGLPLVLVVATFAPHNTVLVVCVLAFVGVGVILHALADLGYAWSLARNTADDIRDAHPAEKAVGTR